MRPGGGKEKGRQFEIRIAQLIGEWWCGVPDAFWRNVASGGRVHTNATVPSGDIVPVKDVGVWPLSIECKVDEQWSFEGFLSGNLSEALLWHFAQMYSDSIKANRKGLLVFSRNRDKVFAALPIVQWSSHPDFFKLLRECPVFLCRQAPRGSGSLYASYPNLKGKSLCFFVLLLDNFFERFSKQSILKWISEKG